MADADGPLSELGVAATKHMESAEAKLSELAKGADPATAQKVDELRKVLGELRALLR
jgi:hypothetical protein